MKRSLLIALAVALAVAAIVVGLSMRRKPEVKVVVPETYRVLFETSQGNFVVEVKRAWAPRGADRFHQLVRMGYYTESRFYRVLDGFIAQFGVHRDFNVHDKWRNYFIIDDPRVEKNLRGTLSFAKSDPNTRATEVFINLKDNPPLDEENFVPFGRIIEGMDIPAKLYSGYGEMRPEGKFIDAGRVEGEANEYLEPRFPKLDYVKKATILP
jgi:peptidyl-prolyl cis-trans isomerase A (cyclophilin A)